MTRASSKNQVENVEEETEAAMAQEMKESGQPEIIDLTDGRPKESESPQQQRDREMFLQQHREYMSKQTLQIGDGNNFKNYSCCFCLFFSVCI